MSQNVLKGTKATSTLSNIKVLFYLESMPTPRRIDRIGEYRTAFDKNRKRILMTQDICAICGKVVDKTLKRPNEYAPEVDHIIPISRGGHPSDISNLQLVHGICNKQKGNKIKSDRAQVDMSLRWSIDWINC